MKSLELLLLLVRERRDGRLARELVVDGTEVRMFRFHPFQRGNDSLILRHSQVTVVSALHVYVEISSLVELKLLMVLLPMEVMQSTLPFEAKLLLPFREGLTLRKLLHYFVLVLRPSVRHSMMCNCKCKHSIDRFWTY